MRHEADQKMGLIFWGQRDQVRILYTVSIRILYYPTLLQENLSKSRVACQGRDLLSGRVSLVVYLKLFFSWNMLGHSFATETGLRLCFITSLIHTSQTWTLGGGIGWNPCLQINPCSPFQSCDYGRRLRSICTYTHTHARTYIYIYVCIYMYVYM